MAEKTPQKPFGALIGIVVVIRVFFMLLVWLALFLAMFFGYFTVPIILIGLIVLIYALSDMGIYVALRRHQRATDIRQSMLSEYMKDPSSEDQDK